GLICGGTMKVAVVPVRTDADVIPFSQAADALESKQNAIVPLRILEESKPIEYRLHIEPPARLIIAGAGHVGAAVARLAVGLDFETRVIDDRADLMGPDRLPPPIIPVVGEIEATLRKERIEADAYVVIVTRGHNHDEQALHAVIGSQA